MSEVEQIIDAYLLGQGLEVERTSDGSLVVQLPGERKLKTTVALRVGQHSLRVSAFVARRPDENQAAVFRFLLEQNRRTPFVSYCLDDHGDIYLTGVLPLIAVSDEVLDQLLGAILLRADGDFNVILELGFRSSIEDEWRWRLSRGEPTFNLAAFEHLRPED
ncbi:MAG: YbjN domain-containing protein [Actinobacteria bacterium]|nr:YbjN domain-containing protein [Actinomycetota bacterium]